MNVAVYCGSSFGNDPEFNMAARRLGTWIAEKGMGLVYGGSSVGLMGTVSGAALAAGGTVVGVEPQFFIDAGVAQHDLTELIVVETMSQRKAKMIELSDVFVALPGGVGTLEEISEIMARVHLELGQTCCYLLDINGYWTPLREMLDSMVETGFLPAQTRAAFAFPRTVDELFTAIEAGL